MKILRTTILVLFFNGNVHAQIDSLLNIFLHSDYAQRAQQMGPLWGELDKLSFETADKLLENTISKVNPLSGICVDVYRLKSHVYYSSKQTAEAIVFTQRALDIATKINDPILMGDCNIDIGFLYRELGFYSFAAEVIQKAEEIFLKQNDLHSSARCLYEVALTHYRAGNTKESLSVQRKSIEQYERLNRDSLPGNHKFFLMSGYNTMGLAYYRLQKFDSALFYYQQASSMAYRTNHIFWQKMVGGNMGEVFLKQGKAREAIPLIKADYNEMKKQGESDLTFTAALNLAECYLSLNQMDSVFLVLNSLDEKGTYMAGRVRLWRVLGKAYERIQNGTLSSHALNKALELQDSIRLNTESVNLTRLKIIYELQQKDDSIHKLSMAVTDKQALLQRQTTLTTVISVFLLFALTGALMFYRFNTKNKSQLKTIDEQNHELEAQSEMLSNLNQQLQERNSAIEKQKEEISMQNQKLRDAIEELKNAQTQMVRVEKMAALGQVTAGIAHEINNPLNFISGGVDALAGPIEELVKLSRQNEQEQRELIDELEKDSQNLLAAIKNGVQRSSKIISSLQTFSSPQESSFSLVYLHEAIDSALTILNSKIKKGQITVTLDYDNTISVFGSVTQLTQVLINLIDNAIQALQHIEAPRKLNIAAVMFANQVQIIIADNGNGIPEELQNKIFDPFFTTKEVGQGTGLGLAISYSIIERHKGKIGVTSKPGRGTEFIIKLPKLSDGI